jgi:hypothetical protein
MILEIKIGDESTIKIFDKAFNVLAVYVNSFEIILKFYIRLFMRLND